MNPTESVLLRSYPVVGSSVSELERSIGHLGPRRGGRVFAAHTDWEIRYRLTESGPAVGLTATVTLPRWIPARSAPAGLQQEWDRYVAALRAHEEGHVRLARQAVRELADQLADCGLDPARADAAAKEVSRRAREAEREYDRETAHGKSDGASLLPA